MIGIIIIIIFYSLPMTTVEFCGDFMYRLYVVSFTVMLCSGFNVYICVLQTTQLNRC